MPYKADLASRMRAPLVCPGWGFGGRMKGGDTRQGGKSAKQVGEWVAAGGLRGM